MREDITRLLTNCDGPMPDRHMAVDAVPAGELALRRELPLIRRAVISMTRSASLYSSNSIVESGQAVRATGEL
jgi:hypothetical protein